MKVVRGFACLAALALPTLSAVAYADEPSAASTAPPTATAPSSSTTSGPSNSTAPPTTTAPAPAATSPIKEGHLPPPPKDDFTTDPETLPREHWYGWQPLILDAAAAIQAALGYATGENAFYVTAGVTYYAGPVLVHVWHGRQGNIVASAALRLLAPGAGAGIGFLVARINSPNGRTDGAVGIGLDSGCVAAAAFDDLYLARETLQFYETKTGPSIVPVLTPKFAGLSFRSSF